MRLREETVRIERRPASDANVADDAFKERSFEVTERGEKAAVSKTPHVAEEVSVRKGVQEQASRETTPASKALYGMLGIFTEFERAMIQERVRAGLRRARSEGKRL